MSVVFTVALTLLVSYLLGNVNNVPRYGSGRVELDVSVKPTEKREIGFGIGGNVGIGNNFAFANGDFGNVVVAYFKRNVIAGNFVELSDVCYVFGYGRCFVEQNFSVIPTCKRIAVLCRRICGKLGFRRSFVLFDFDRCYDFFADFERELITRRTVPLTRRKPHDRKSRGDKHNKNKYQ